MVKKLNVIISVIKITHLFELFMKNLFIICFAILVALNTGKVNGQNDSSFMDLKLHYDSLYGMDPNLYNGIRYFPEHPQARGFPFWKEDNAMIFRFL